MPSRGVFTLSNLEEYLEKIAAAGQDVDQACAEALEEAAPIVTKKMHEDLRASSETWTGATDATIEQAQAQREGNYTFVEITAGGAPAEQAFYKEFGTARQAAEPFFRPSFTNRRHLWRNALKAALKARGMTA
jgi:HK97 gp10 family phage protein